MIGKELVTIVSEERMSSFREAAVLATVEPD